MRKKLLTILLSIAVILTSTVAVFATTFTTSGEIFATVTGSIYSWANEKGNTFDGLASGDLDKQPVSTSDNLTYTFSYGDVDYSLETNGEVLKSIIVANCPATDYNGTYTAPVTIANILATNPNFPKSETDDFASDSWINGNKIKMCYFPNNSLKLKYGNQGYTGSEIVTKINDSKYIYEKNGHSNTFNLTNGVLTSVEVSGFTDNWEKWNGTYAPKSKTIADILATVDSFPSSDSLSNIPADAWIKTGGSKLFINTSEKTLVASNSSVSFSLESELTLESENKYKCTGALANVHFVLENSELASIEIDGCTFFAGVNGTYAEPVTVTFDASLFGVTVPSQTIPKGTTATKPEEPVKEGYVFNYWSLVGVDEEFDFTAPIVDNEVSLYANGRRIEIRDILPDNFPTAFKNGWKDENGSRMYLGSDLSGNPSLIHGTNETYKYLNVTKSLTKVYDKYHTNNGHDLYDFYVDQNGKLTKITFNSNTYEPMTIADILATAEGGFPTTEASAWVNFSKDTIAYKRTFGEESALIIAAPEKYIGLSLEYPVEADGSNYVYSDSTGTVTFNMVNDKLSSITFAHNTEYQIDTSLFDGTYVLASNYEITDGKQVTINVNDNKDVLFTSSADFSKFVEVKVDNNTVAEKYYKAETGSTKVTMKASYLSTLAEGNHTFTIVSNDGKASTTFTITKASKPSPSPYIVPDTSVR